jgi:hypothetical protein
MKRLFSFSILTCLLALFAVQALAADSPRQRFSLDYDWKFTLGDPA